MSFRNKILLGVKITTSHREYILEEIRKYLNKIQIPNSKFQNKEIKPLVIYTPNPEIITYAQKDPTFKKNVNSAQINIPDGMGLCFSLKKIYGVDVKQIAGVDFMLELCQLSSELGLRIGLIGGRGKVALVTLKCLKQSYNYLKGWAIEGPEIKMENGKWKMENYNKKLEIKETADKISKEKTDILFVAFGFPKQEYYIDLLRRHLSLINYQLPIILMSVGGAFDYISGRVPRAPKWMRDRGLEWLFRLVFQPWRIGRQIRGAGFFIKTRKS